MTNLVSSGFASVPNASLYYEVAGEGTPVVLIPGYTLDTRSGMISSQPLRKVISWFATTCPRLGGRRHQPGPTLILIN